MVINDTIQKMKDYLSNEPIDTEDDTEREEYLDRLGAVVPQNERAQNQPQSFVDAVFRPQMDFESMHLDSFENSRQDNTVITWSNGDREVRRRNPPRLSSYYQRDPQLRRASSDYVHQQVISTKRYIAELIIHDCGLMIKQFNSMTRDNRQSRREYETAVISMVDHYLEDIGDDIIMRYDIKINTRYEINETVLTIKMELPIGLIYESNILLSPMFRWT